MISEKEAELQLARKKGTVFYFENILPGLRSIHNMNLQMDIPNMMHAYVQHAKEKSKMVDEIFKLDEDLNNMKQYLGAGYDQATEKLEWQRKKALNKLKRHQSDHVSEVIKRKMSIVQPREQPKITDSKTPSEHGKSLPVVEHAHLTVEESQKIWENTLSTLLSNKV